MNKEGIDRLVGLITDMKNRIEELKQARDKKDSAGLEDAKRKIISIQVQINRIT